MNRLLVFGAGYSATACACRAASAFAAIAGTTRTPERAQALREAGLEPVMFSGAMTGELAASIRGASHILVSIAPGETGDPVLAACRDALLAAPDLVWIGYLSTVGVYGDHGGGWVDEQSECRPVSKRSVERLEAERAWAALARRKKVPLAILRLSGIYGPGRSAFVNIEAGTARRLVKPGHSLQPHPP